MIIRLGLGLFFLALLLLISADIISTFGLGSLTGLIIRSGIALLLSSLLVLLFSGLILLAKRLQANIKAYFSAPQRALRYLWFSQTKTEQQQQRYNLQKQQIAYFAELKRKRLLQKNNQRQCRLIAKDIYKQLSRLKKQLPKKEFQAYQQQIKNYCRQQNIDALFTCSAQISSLKKSK